MYDALKFEFLNRKSKIIESEYYLDLAEISQKMLLLTALSESQEQIFRMQFVCGYHKLILN